ncbi:hypothetical protein NL676_007068 [Syzygium grande]|nr:hypothetical protein NL676_007068 [Syzygium grande]
MLGHGFCLAVAVFVVLLQAVRPTRKCQAFASSVNVYYFHLLCLQQVTCVPDLIFSLPWHDTRFMDSVLILCTRRLVSGSSASTLNFSTIGCLSSVCGFILLSTAFPEDLSVNVDTRPCERGSTAPSRMLFVGESAFEAL